jgi:prepilin-type N-terminal cleavage/methylation domain-containing protein
MMRSAPRSAAQRGFTLIELMITLIVLTLIMGSTVAFFKSQSRSFGQGSDKLEVLQNARFSVSQIDRILRTLGAGVTGQQPMLVYGGDDVVAFNTDYTENDTTNFRWAVNFNPSIDSTLAYAWQVGDATTVPNTSYTYPPLTYRQANGALSPAETKIFWFSSDSSTSRTDDYILWERTNAGTAEIIARNILQYPSRPFFQYFLARRLSSGADTLMITPSGLIPLIRKTPTAAFTGADSSSAIRPDSIKAIRINIRVTNGQTGAAERVRDFAQIVQVPNNGLAAPTVCGRSPFPPQSVTDSAVSDSGTVFLRWTPSIDQSSGEGDVWQYVVYVRKSWETTWSDPWLMVRRDTSSVYRTTIAGLMSDTTYTFGVSAMDCTPSQSSIVTHNVMVP